MDATRKSERPAARGGRLIVLSNRAPYSPITIDGKLEGWAPAVGGLTAALDPVLRERGGTWIAWGEGHESVESVTLPPQQPRYRLQRLRLSSDEVRLHYHGLANGALWPLSHYFLEHARYRQEEWLAYERVNRRFAQAALAEHEPGDTVWVHDYHLALVPGMLRAATRGAAIGFFWHVPWPAPEVFRTFPWARELLEGLLGADLIGVHTEEYQRNLAGCCRAVLGREWDGEAVLHRGRRVRIEVRPIGVEAAALERLGRDPQVLEAARRIREQVGTRILLGVDRLDYSKGIPERLQAYAEHLGTHPESRGRVTLVQVAVPSRESVSAYRDLREQVEGLVGRINGSYGGNGWAPVHYHYRSLGQRDLAAHYAAADAMLVTPLRDGLNLVAKEFACVSRGGALVLSEFAGAASELPQATLVNPYDREGAAERIAAALAMPLRERARRLAGMKAHLLRHDLSRWAGEYLESLAGGRGGTLPGRAWTALEWGAA
ncbi:MAG TPA: trehalose-6-phosphate synthase [Deinococcales bacterium]|nr:trehalose-6-phosphate synthase [Deinococcales bacterium]